MTRRLLTQQQNRAAIVALRNEREHVALAHFATAHGCVTKLVEHALAGGDVNPSIAATIVAEGARALEAAHTAGASVAVCDDALATFDKAVAAEAEAA
jgi:hypothetical protein